MSTKLDDELTELATFIEGDIDPHVVETFKKHIKALLNELVGEDEQPDTMKPAGVVDGKRQYEPAYSLRATVLNERLADLRKRIEEL